MAPFLKLRNFEIQQLLLSVDGNVLAWVLPLFYSNEGKKSPSLSVSHGPLGNFFILVSFSDQLQDSNPRRDPWFACHRAIPFNFCTELSFILKYVIFYRCLKVLSKCLSFPYSLSAPNFSFYQSLCSLSLLTSLSALFLIYCSFNISFFPSFGLSFSHSPIVRISVCISLLCITLYVLCFSFHHNLCALSLSLSVLFLFLSSCLMRSSKVIDDVFLSSSQ